MSVWDSLVAIAFPAHIVLGSALAFMMVFTQLILKRVMALIPESEGKAAARLVIRARVRRSMDVVIVALALTALILLVDRWGMIVASKVLLIKVHLGALALLIALTLHFGLDRFKVRYIASGNVAKVKALAVFTRALEGVVFALAWVTYLLAIYHNHA